MIWVFFFLRYSILVFYIKEINIISIFLKMFGEVGFLIIFSKWYKLYKCSLLKIKICLEVMYKIYLNEIYYFNFKNSGLK